MSYIKGIDSLLSKLKALPVNIQEGALDGVQNTVLAIKKDAKELCPVDSGELRDSIVSEAKKLSAIEIEGTVTTQKDYALAVEFGTGQQGASSSELAQLGISVPHDNDIVGRAPTPFMYPAYILNRDTGLDNIKERITNNIRKVAKR
jgi:HK97 gp10 family phage protein